MRLLLDEHLDRRLKRFFGEEYEVVTVRERGWGSLSTLPADRPVEMLTG